MYGDDDYMTTEQALDAGWLTSEDAQSIKDILATVDITP